MLNGNSQQARVLPETDQPKSSANMTAADPCSVPSSSTATSTSSDTPAQATSNAMPHIQSDQPSVSLLASYGIKVRDFAYESTLPPIAPVPRLPRQVQPGPRPLKRARKDYDGKEDEPFSQPVSSQGGRSVSDAIHTEVSKTSRPLGRKLTEPASDSSNRLSSRARAYTDLSGYIPLANMTHPLRTLSIQFPAGSPPTASQSNDPSQHPLTSPSASQGSEPYIHTPSVTPNGSLQWPLPPCQLSDDSQLPEPDISCASPKVAWNDLELRRPGSPRVVSPSPMKAQTSSLLPSPSIGLFKSTPSPPVAQRTLLVPEVGFETEPEMLSTEPPVTTSPRYFLRKRPAASPQTSPRPPSRARSSRPVPSPRPPVFSIQAAHSASKSHIGDGSPRARTLRKSGREGSMVAS